MADYRDLLRRAIEALPENNGNARRQVYDKARAALRKQLDAIQPELPSREKTHHRLQLEECIREVEQEATERILSGLSQLDNEDYAPHRVVLPGSDAESQAAPPRQEPIIDEPEPVEDDAMELEGEPDVEEFAAEEPVVEETDAEPVPKAEPEDPVNAEAELEPEPVTVLDADVASTGPEHMPAVKETDVAAQAEMAKSEAAPELVLTESPATGDELEDDAMDPDEDTAVVEAEPAPKPDVAEHLHTAPDVVAAEAAIGAAAAEPPKQNPIWSRFKTRPADTATATSALATTVALRAGPALVAEQAMSSEREVDLDTDPQNAIDHAIAVLDREASGGAMSDSTIETADPDTADLGFARAEAEEEGGGSPALTIFLLLVLLLLAGAGGAGYWAWREGYLDRNLFGSDAQVGVSQTATDIATAPRPAATVRQVESPVADTSDSADATPTGPGNTAAMPDVVETPATGLQQAEDNAGNDLPADALALASPAEQATAAPTMDAADQAANVGNTAADNPAADAANSVADESVAEPAAAEDKSDERLPVAEATSEATTDAANATTAKPEVVADGSQSLLLEASDSANSGAVPFSGTVEWTRGVDELGQPTLEATANIPARNMSVALLIRKNSDASLPASHLVEIDFNVSDSFIGGGISRIAGILLKNEELVQGVPLVGASARVVGNTFLFALSASNQDVTKNVDLLSSRKWMDLAIIYSTGKQAILTLEKDAAAVALFNDVMAVWNPAAEAAPATETTTTEPAPTAQ